MRRLLIFGDSYVAAADRGRPGYARLAPLLLGCRGSHDGLGGTGFVKTHPGRGPYASRLDAIRRAQPDVLVVQGSGNDAVCDLGDVDAAARVFLTVAARLSGALFVVGPMWAKDGAEHLPALRDVMRDATPDEATFVDALGWVTQGLIGPDGAHPTRRGHWVIAHRLASSMRSLLPAGEVAGDDGP